MKKKFFPLVLLCLTAAAGEVFLDLSSAEDVKKLKIENGTVSVRESGLRFQVNANIKGRTGFISKRIAVPKTGGFLQLEQPNIEDAGAAPFLSDKSKNGRSLGPVNIGLNTYDLSYRKGQNFVLSLRQKGAMDRTKTGPWADYRYIRITDCPKGAVLASIRGKKSGEVLTSGDTLDFVYYPSKNLTSLKAEIVIVPGFIPYFSVELKADAKGVLRGSYTVPATLPGFHSTAKTFLAARSHAEESASTSIFGFPVKIDGKGKIDLNEAFVPATPFIRKARAKWHELMKGKNNLALGKTVTLVPQATYPLNHDGNDEKDLTDGKLSARSDDRIWFDRHAVGWQSSPCCMKIDLGEVKPVSHTVVRMLGGAGKNSKLPASFEVFISRDGETWHPASELKKLQPGEKEQSDWKTTYYLDESSEVFVWPFALAVNAEARYVLLRITGGGARTVVSDEWAVLEGNPAAAGFNAAYRNPGVKIPLAGLVAQVRAGVLAVAKELPMAQFIQLTDLRDEKAKKRPAKIVLEVPAGVTVCPTAKNPLSVTPLPDGGTKVEFNWQNLGKREPPAVYFKAVKDSIPGKAAVYAICNGKEQFRCEYPVQVLEFPEFEPFQKLHISLAWISESYQQNWPDFFRVWKRLGFNWICVFPMYHKTLPEPESLAFCEVGKKHGFKLLMNLNVLPDLAKKSTNSKEIFCSGNNEKHGGHAKGLCPSYCGTEYQKEMTRVADYVAAYKPQAFFDDNEVWTHARDTARKCPRCQPAQKKSGKSWEEFLYACGARYAADLKKAIEAGAKRGNSKVELIGSYGRSPSRPIYQIQRFEEIYPASIDHSQPSLYVAGRGNIVRDTVRFNCRAQKNKAQIPFLTAGTYGEFASEKMELMVLESFLNGACGITFYKYSTFDTPLDFYYMSKALALLRPYEEFILKSDLAEVPLSNRGLSVSALRSGNELLVLVANYTGAKPETELTLPVDGKVTDLVTGKALPVSGKKILLSVPSGKFQLLHIK